MSKIDRSVRIHWARKDNYDLSACGKFPDPNHSTRNPELITCKKCLGSFMFRGETGIGRPVQLVPRKRRPLAADEKILHPDVIETATTRALARLRKSASGYIRIVRMSVPARAALSDCIDRGEVEIFESPLGRAYRIVENVK